KFTASVASAASATPTAARQRHVLQSRSRSRPASPSPDRRRASWSTRAKSLAPLTSSQSEIGLTASSTAVHERRSQYRCPRPFCTKVYGSLNGLRYHLERGNCEIEAGPDGKLPAAALAAALAAHRASGASSLPNDGLPTAAGTAVPDPTPNEGESGLLRLRGTTQAPKPPLLSLLSGSAPQASVPPLLAATVATANTAAGREPGLAELIPALAFPARTAAVAPSLQSTGCLPQIQPAAEAAADALSPTPPSQPRPESSAPSPAEAKLREPAESGATGVGDDSDDGAAGQDQERELLAPPPADEQLLPADIRIAHRPYWCRVAGCGRRYKNLNGLKYHGRVAHPDRSFLDDVKGHAAHNAHTSNHSA
ncbi:hypothetical protein HK405_012958, partial [Cladochytrium tenue]